VRRRERVPAADARLVLDPASGLVVAVTVVGGTLEMYRSSPSGWVADASATLSGLDSTMVFAHDADVDLTSFAERRL
jgi:hypothetical protein